MVRMRDIADQLGISVSTVSLALNHKDKGRVNPPLAEKIRTTANGMGYRPNPHALGLKLSKSHAIALICNTGPDDPFLSGLTGGAQAANATAESSGPAATEIDASHIGGLETYVARCREHFTGAGR